MREKLIRYKKVLVSILAWISGLSFFIPLGLIVLLGSLVVNPKKFDSFIKAGCRSLVRMLFIRVRIEGRESIRKNQTYLFMSNHVNLFDVFVLYGHIPNFACGVELDKHFQWPFYGAIIRRMGIIPISHTNARAAVKSLDLAKSALTHGTSIIILPEGGRTLNGKFKPFKRGPFVLAKEAGADIVPMVMVGAYEINRKGSLMIHPGKVTLRFGQPISFNQIKNREAEEIKSYVHQKMSDLFYQ